MKKITLFITLILSATTLCFAQPANDDPSGATSLTVGVVFADNAIVADNIAATDSEVADPTIPAPGCSNYAGGDVWFTVQVPASGGITVETRTDGVSTMDDTGMAIYSGSIGSFALVECDDDDSSDGFFSLISLSGRTPNEILYVRVFEYGNNLFDTFQISAYNDPVLNDECTGAFPVSCGDIVTGSTVSATDSGNNPSYDVFYSFTDTVDQDVTLSLCNSGYDTFVRVFSDCPQTTQIAGNDDFCGTRSQLTFTALANNTYYIMIEGYGGNEGVYEMEVTCDIVIPTPPNDEVANATPLTLGLDLTGETTAGATQSAGENPTCDLFGFIADVWYSFSAPASGEVTVETTITGTSDQANVAVYSTMSNLQADQIGCVDANGGETLALTGLTSGNTYYVKVWSDGAAARRTEGTFDILVSDSTLSTVDLNNENSFSYFPNPVNDKLTLRAQNNIQNVSVYNMLGQEVVRTAPNTLTSEVDMNTLSSGAYFVQVTINDTTETIRVIKK